MKSKERRAKPRVDCTYPAIVRGTDAKGKSFKEQCTLHNFCAVGLYLSLSRAIEVGSQLSISFRFSSQPSEKIKLASVKARGIVVRSETLSQTKSGIGVKVEHYLFR